VNPPLHRSSPADAERHRLAWARYPADLTTPVGAFLALRAAGRHACLLESVERTARLTRFSFVGVDPVARFRGRRDGATLATGAGEEQLAGPPHAALRAAARRFGAPPVPRGLPPFTGGWIGWFAYEWATTLEPRVPRAARDPWGVPEATFDLYRDVLAFDHATQELYVIGAAPGGAAEHARAMERLDAIAADLDGARLESGRLELLEASPRPRTSREEYEAGVRELQRAIREGEVFQAVLSQRFEQPCAGDPFTLYRVLRLTNPSPHMFFYQCFEPEGDGLALVGSSPERLVSVHNGHVQAVPIAGTRRRADDPDEDERLGAELLADPKERAEHDMLVDLARNDLGRVARVGTVELKEHAVLERFSRVQHLVSRVEARLATGADALDALAACFPAGTVSGAPKVRAMELLSALEGETRGPYAGCFGYLDASGNLDMAIAIRTLAVRDGVVHLQVGAGVVHDSVPSREYAETLEKARALLDSIALADSPAFRPRRQPTGASR
jgi:anthranilate synthase component 1